MILNRRILMQILGLAPAMPWLSVGPVRAQERVFRHGATLIEPLQYPQSFKNWRYVNPDAPKGGRVRLATLGTFDSINPFTDQGDVASVGVNETLMEQPLDEPSSEYALIAEGFWYPDDYSEVVFKINPAAKFNDGEPIKPEDVIFSYETLKANTAAAAAYYKDIISASKTGEREVTFKFGVKGNRELPQITAQIPIAPKHWWTAKDASGRQRDITKTTLEPPLGSGPYECVSIKPGSSYVLRRVKDYWAKGLPNSVGTYNFDEYEIQFYQDRAVLLEAFKGDQFDIHLESSSKQWATGYDFPAVKDGRVIKEAIPKKGVNGMQAWTLNQRRSKFQDVRVRQALDLAYDFEWANTNLFYGVYKRSRSYFNNSEFEATGLPSAEELKLLEPLREQIPPEVFTAEYKSYVNETPEARRKNLRAAQKLLTEAGWKAVDVGGKRILKNEKGESFTIDLVLDSPTFERVALPYKEQLALLGIDMVVRIVDAAQYERLQETHEYDMDVGTWPQSLSPGNEQREFFGTEFADRKQTRNAAGIKNPAIDALIDKIILAPTRADLITACKAMDRVLMANHYVVPMWFKAEDWIAYWIRVKHPDNMPGHALGYPTIWWFDAEGDAKIKKA
jgi:microcin C transport system substrate-binding protein